MTLDKNTVVWPEGYGRVVVPEVGSTLDAAAAQAKSAAVPFWLLAHRQTAARGRRGRLWSMPDGNFAATLAMHPGGPPENAALRSFVMSVALIDALDAATGQPRALALKWPNDVLLNGGKVAGILLERSGSGTLFIGVGINLAARPDAEALEPSALRPVAVREETGVALRPEPFLDLLGARYAETEQQFNSGGFAPVRAAWLARAARLGERITARTMREDVTGIFEDVDGQGQLVIRGARGIERLAAADVYF